MDDAKPRRRRRKAERQDKILVELQLKPHVRTNELADLFGVTTETIRRDMDELSQLGKLSRSYGGALASHAHPGLDSRDCANVRERQEIGRRGAALVRAGETLMIDAGSTTIQLARAIALSATPVVAITNSLQIATALALSPTAKVILCPGDYLPREGAVVGVETIEFLGRFNVSRALVGASAISEHGVTEAVPGFAAVKRAMIRQARKAHLLINSSKFGITHLTAVANLKDFQSIVSDRHPDGALSAKLEQDMVEILLPI